MYSEGFTLLELVIVIAVAGIALAAAQPAIGNLRDARALRAASDVVRHQLGLARRSAVHGRERVLFRRSADRLVIETVDGSVRSSVALTGVDGLPVDSVRLRPATFRFNARGQAAPGSVYLYRGGRSIRIVCNFLGRVRVEPTRRSG